jgi:hypothetical protein
VNEVPPSQDPADEVDDLYRRASARDPSRPSEAVRRRVLDHAAQLAAERAATAATEGPTKIGFARRAYRSSWRPAIFGTLAAAGLAGLLIAPQFLTPRGPGPLLSREQHPLPKAEEAPAPETTAPAAQATAPAPAAQASAATGAAPAPASPELTERLSQYAADEPLVSVPRKQVQSALRGRVAARNAVPADSAAQLAAKNAPDELQNLTASQSTAAASAGAATEEKRARTAGSPVNALSAPTALSAGAQPPMSAPTPTERVQVTAARRTDPAAELRRAAENGDVAKLQTLLDGRPVVDARDADGRTALMVATLHGQAHVVDVLLAHGADPNAADANGTTPLQAALAGAQPSIAAALQRAGAR